MHFLYALSSQQNRRQTIVLTLEGIETAGSDIEFKVLSTIDTTLEPMEMRGNIIAFADESSQTVIFNRRTGLSGLLQHEQEQGVFLVSGIQYYSTQLVEMNCLRSYAGYTTFANVTVLGAYRFSTILACK